MADGMSHYEVLRVERDASDDAIRRSFKRLALYWHPDKNPDNREEASEMFSLISEAYAVLGDPEQRRRYDRDTRLGDEKGVGKAAATPARSTRPGPPYRPAAATPVEPDPPQPSAPPTPQQGSMEWDGSVASVGRPYPTRPTAPPVPPPELGGWNGGGMAWQGSPVSGDGAGWPHPHHQGPPGFPQSHNFQQPALYPMYQQENPFFPQQGHPLPPPGGPFAQPFVQQGHPFQQYPYQQQQPGGYPFQQQPGHFQQQQGYGSPVPPNPAQFDPYYGSYGMFNAVPSPPAPSVASERSTELTLAQPSPPLGAPQPSFEQGRAPFFGMAGVPPPTLPMATPVMTAMAAGPLISPAYGPGMGLECEASDSDEEYDAVVASRMHRPVGNPSPSSSSASNRGGALSLFRRRSQPKPSYPTETRYVPPPPPEFLDPSYPKETRVANATTEGQQRHQRESQNLGRSARVVLTLGLTAGAPTPASPSPAPTAAPVAVPFPPAPAPVSQQRAPRTESACSLFGGRSSRTSGSDRGGGLFGGGGLLAQIFSGAMGGMLSAGGGVDVDNGASDGRRGSGVRNSFSGTSSGGAGEGRVSTRMSRRMSVGAEGDRTYFFSRTEKTVINPDGTRDTQVEEVVDDRRGDARTGVTITPLDSPRRW